MKEGSSSTQTRLPDSSTQNPYSEGVMSKPKTPGQIRAQGEVDLAHGDLNVKKLVLKINGALAGLLILIGGAAFFINPDNSKDVWVIIGPLIATSISGTIGFLTGEKLAK